MQAIPLSAYGILTVFNVYCVIICTKACVLAGEEAAIRMGLPLCLVSIQSQHFSLVVEAGTAATSKIRGSTNHHSLSRRLFKVKTSAFVILVKIHNFLPAKLIETHSLTLQKLESWLFLYMTQKFNIIKLIHSFSFFLFFFR